MPTAGSNDLTEAAHAFLDQVSGLRFTWPKESEDREPSPSYPMVKATAIIELAKAAGRWNGARIKDRER